MSKFSGYGYSSRSGTPLDKVYEKHDSKVRRKEKINNNMEYYAIDATALVVAIWLTLGVLFWLNGKKIEGFTIFIVLTLFILSLICVLILAIISVVSGVRPSLKKIARKTLIKAELEESSQEIMANHLFDNSEIREVFYKKLEVTPNQANDMETLVAEGYLGTVANLVTVVKKL